MFKLLCDEKEVTYGQRYLLNLLEERKFENTITNDGDQWDYTQSIGFRKFQKIENLKSWSIENGFSYVSMWIIATGRRNPSYAKIKQLKNFVYPSDWFFNE